MNVLLARVFAAALSLSAGTTIAATLFVATDGDDSNAGTEAKPWKTLHKAAASVQPGDIVRIKAGEYPVAPTWTVRQPGTAESPITYQGYGGAVRITGSSIVPPDAWKLVKGAIYAAEVSERVLSVFRNDLPLHDPGDGAKIFSVEEMIPNSFFKSGTTLHVWLDDGSEPKNSVMRIAPDHVISLRDCHHTIFDGLTVEFGFNGFKDQAATHHITIRNCTIRSIASQGIQPVAKNCLIERNVFQKIGTNKYQHGIYGSEPGTIIRGNVFEEIAGAGIHQYNQDHPAGGGCEFSGNVFRKPRRMTVRSGPASGSYYTDIIAWGEGGNLICNNVHLGEGKRSAVSLNSTNNRVFHNTFLDCTSAIGFHAGKPGNRVMNNLVLNAGKFIIWPKNSLPQTLDYNLYHNATEPPRWEHDGITHRTFSDYQKAAGEAHSLSVNPRHAAGARLQVGSPIIDAGTALSDVPADFNGVARPQGTAPDIGAYEFR